LTDRLARELLELDVPLERSALVAAARAMLPDRAPLARADTVEAAVDALIGLGPIEVLLRDPAVSDVLVNGDGRIWVERAGVLDTSDIRFPDAEAVLAAVERVITPLGLRLDRSSPAVDARLADGSRLHAVIPPASVDGPVVAVRRFTEAVVDLEAMIRVEAVDAIGAALLQDAIAARHNVLVAGGTGAGKTTLLNVLSKEIAVGERIVTVEDAAELRLTGHVVRLEARPPNAEGTGGIELRSLVRHALRLRPDRIIVGEVRGAEALDMIQAMNTGHAGSLSTVHANSPVEALWRIETLAMSGDPGVGSETVRRQLWAALDVIVQVERRRGGRRVASIATVDATSGEVEVVWCST
jgi:pilus assembly protein CpaF